MLSSSARRAIQRSSVAVRAYRPTAAFAAGAKHGKFYHPILVFSPLNRLFPLTLLHLFTLPRSADAHDDHEHHDHPMFEELPFKKSTIGPAVVSCVVGGVSLIWFACVFQNKKHGFPQKG